MVQHLTIKEFLNAKEQADQYVVLVKRHKTRDKEPASIVLSGDMYDYMKR